MPRGKKEKKSKKEKKPKNEKKPKKGKRVKATDQPADIAEQVVLENARSVANRELPPAPPSAYTPDLNGILPVTLVLFYQYVEPVWTAKQHKKFLSFVISLGGEHNITGRGRCAPEGLNCTLMGTPSGVRDFCMGLRTANPLFNETDFKLTDGVDPAKKFKALTIRKVDELVAYGLEGEKAPSLKDNTTKHVEAIDYHRMMEDKDTVIIDVRNAYESAIGHFNPPPGGAELIDPKMRNSKEFPKWLNAPETQEKLNGKKVMMYCTGGIRCERASALLDSMTKANPEFKTQGVSMIRGGVERYMRTFPEGGYWKGSNFLFDRRFEQIPEAKPAEKLAEEIESCCCVCWKPWNQYRGQYACHLLSCKVPVLVCSDCHEQGAVKDVKLRCPLCIEGFQLRHLPAPDLKRARPAGESAYRCVHHLPIYV
jgi:predicted sulfurtransferase